MKKILCALLAVSFGSLAYADIHMPPAADQGPTRKLSRGVSNILYGITEFPHSIATVNKREGNSAAASYGVARGVGRTFVRWGTGVFEVATFPFPTNQGKYTPPYRPEHLWLSSGYQEFPPELGFRSASPYNRNDYD